MSEETRQAYREYTLLAEFKRERSSNGKPHKEGMVTVRCSCGREVTMTRSKWQNTPPERCLKCSTKKKKRSGGPMANAW
jgi:hypothetical protein